MKILKIDAIEILDSRGNPTVEVNLTLEDGTKARAMVPSGASTGEREAYELRDGDKKRYGGKGVLKAVANVNTIIANEIEGKCFGNQRELDYFLIGLDGTPNKAHLGANAILGVSMAFARAKALSEKTPLYQYLGGANAYLLPVPCMNIINGGRHADNNVDFQEFMIAPHNAPTFTEAIRMGEEVFQSLKSVLKAKNYSTGVGDEGGFAPDLKSNDEAVEVILEAIAKAGYKPGDDVSICLDPAASELWEDGKYKMFKSTGKFLSSDEMIKLWESWTRQYPIVLLEDGLAENDWEGWKNLTQTLGNKVELVGDDIFCTNKEILAEGISKNVANSILIKLNQIGTVTETLETIELAYKNGYNCFVSHRSGETVDSFIADLTVAVNAGHLKTGSGCRGERVEKFNQLMRIEHELGKASRFAGIKAFKNK
ncbi:MAG: phosphopyruvate hydratase [Bacteroidetes bacterium GWD2_45_23]|nr:MAG: phosphopyruvate hydratase [Bacteroidetes bacterium GWC2_46_850]OFX74567.1 MAG: phosphopyruvate hydratase [Bacteroidetes bacterium GWC1_47_7]OFX82708.1 MAG: phosphopyruvate hydratase [Bacteroidetes bacterium GWD2_45_23]HAR39397.1 phosphopyruvate hydratase [Porphyromonadaceae bacterium]HBB02004.1 phosphopyruvate hydratase [Porphyromonadaceae bacterium]